MTGYDTAVYFDRLPPIELIGYIKIRESDVVRRYEADFTLAEANADNRD
jgi:hypothetical protein